MMIMIDNDMCDDKNDMDDDNRDDNTRQRAACDGKNLRSV